MLTDTAGRRCNRSTVYYTPAYQPVISIPRLYGSISCLIALPAPSSLPSSQADSLRQQTLQQMHRILNTRQSARGLLAMGDYFARLRALSSLWAARPRDQ